MVDAFWTARTIRTVWAPNDAARVIFVALSEQSTTVGAAEYEPFAELRPSDPEIPLHIENEIL